MAKRLLTEKYIWIETCW